MNTPLPEIERNLSCDCWVILGILNLPEKNAECAAEVTSRNIVRVGGRWLRDGNAMRTGDIPES